MSELIVIVFDNKYEADEVMLSLLKLEKDYLIDLEDAVVLTKNLQSKVRIKPYYDLIAHESLSNDFWGKLLTDLVIEPTPEKLAKLNIQPNFAEQVEENLKPNTSAMFMLVRNSEPDKVLAELQKFKGTILHSSLPPDAEKIVAETLS